MFKYSDYETETVNGMRWYITPDGALPSITTVLGITEPEEKKASLENWRNSLGRDKAAAHTKAAAEHGTMVHTLAERYLKKQEVFAPVNGKQIAQEDKNAFNSLKLKLNLINEVWAQEQAVYSPILEVAGRMDCVGEYRGVPSIVDFKTAGRVKNKADIADYELQLCFYAQAHNELYGTNIKQGVIIMAAAKGFPLEFIIDLPAKMDELCGRVAGFWSRVLADI